MKRFSLFVVSAAVMMTACTDYHGEIQAAHEEYQKNLAFQGGEVTGSAVCGDMWCGIRDLNSRVNSGLGQDARAGWWYWYTDVESGGSSAFIWPMDVPDGFDSFSSMVQTYGGIKGNILLGEGYDYPYVGLAFDLVNASREGADITEWGGLCVVYSSTKGLDLKIAVENEATVVEYNNYGYRLPKSEEITVVDASWDNFKQKSGFGKKVDRAEVLKKVGGVVIELSDISGTTADFFIQSIGRLGSCN